MAILGEPTGPVVTAPAEGTEIHTDPKPPTKPNQPTPPKEAEAPLTQEQQLYYDMKVNGKDRRYTIDQLKAKASLGEAATERFEEASAKEKKYQQWKDSAKKDLLSALQDPELGLTRDEIRVKMEQWYKENFIDPETMTEEQKRLRDLEKYKKGKEEEETTAKERQELEAKAQEEREAVESAQKEIIETLKKSGLQQTRFNAGRIAYWMKANLQRGYNAPMAVILNQVKAERADIFSHEVKERPIEEILSEEWGQEFINRVRKFDLERLKTRFASEKPVPTTRKEASTKSMADVDAYFNDLRRSKRT